MKRLFSHRSTQSLVVAVIAVMVALGGTALATSGGGSSRDASAVTAKKKKPKRPSRLVRRYVARYVKHHPGPRGRRGPEGDAGAKGAPGQKGATGSSGVARTGYVESARVSLAKSGDSGDSTNLTATCPTGFVPTGGGFDIGDYASDGAYIDDDPDIQIGTSDYDDDNFDGVKDGWFVYVRNFGDGQGSNAGASAQVFAACAQGADATPAQIRHALAVFARQPALQHRG